MGFPKIVLLILLVTMSVNARAKSCEKEVEAHVVMCHKEACQSGFVRYHLDSLEGCFVSLLTDKVSEQHLQFWSKVHKLSIYGGRSGIFQFAVADYDQLLTPQSWLMRVMADGEPQTAIAKNFSTEIVKTDLLGKPAFMTQLYPSFSIDDYRKASIDYYYEWADLNDPPKTSGLTYWLFVGIALLLVFGGLIGWFRTKQR